MQQATVLVISAMLRSAVDAAEETKTLAGDLMPKPSFEKEETDGLPFLADAVADSLTGFGDTQGASGWQYGTTRTEDRPANVGVPAAVRPLERYETGWWRHRDSLVPARGAADENQRNGAHEGFSPTVLRIAGTGHRESECCRTSFRVATSTSLVFLFLGSFCKKSRIGSSLLYR